MIEVQGLVKSYGERLALKGISFRVRRGEILGFLGPNGAGKTTTMKILTGLIPATAGRASVAGFDVHEQSLESRRRIGYLPEHPPLYREMVVRDFLRFACELRAVPRKAVASSVDRAIQLCGLTEVAGRIVGRLSKGYRQRVGLAQAIVHDPEVLILDEPTVGLDPKQIVEIRSLVRGFSGERTVILSTHILPEVTMTCERVVIIDQGNIVAEDTIENLTEKAGQRQSFQIRVARDREDLGGSLERVPGVVRVERDPKTPSAYLVTADAILDGQEQLAAAVVQSGCGLLEMKCVSASLEEVFLGLITQEKEVAA